MWLLGGVLLSSGVSGCDDAAPGSVTVDAAPVDMRVRDAELPDMQRVLDAQTPPDASDAAGVADARPGDAATVCHDRDEDGVTDCQGDCADDDPRVHPGAVEPCGGADADCDGVLDERCVQAGDAVQWRPVERAAALTVGPMPEGGNERALRLDLPALDDFRVLIDLELVRITPREDGGAFGRVVLKLAQGHSATIDVRPHRPLSMRYRGRSVPMDARISTGGPVQLIVERVAGRLRAGASTGTPGSLWVPAPVMPTLELPPALTQVVATCVDCEMRVDRLDVGRPVVAPPRPWQPCPNRLRNADFAHHTDGAPDGWRVGVAWRVRDRVAEPARWRAQLGRARIGARGMRLPEGDPVVTLSQAITVPREANRACADMRVDVAGEGMVEVEMVGAASDVCPCRAPPGPVALPAAVAFTACAVGEAQVRLRGVEAAQLQHVMAVPGGAAAARCVAWPDRPPPRLPVPWAPPLVDPQDGVARVPLRRPDGRLAGADILVAIDKTVDVSFPALGGNIDITWRARRGAPALVTARLPAQVPATIELPLPLAHVVREGGLQVVHVPHAGEIASIAPTVTPTIDNPLAYATVRLPPGEGALPPPIPAARFADRPRQVARVAGRIDDGTPEAHAFGPDHLSLLRALGVGGVSLADPDEAQVGPVLQGAAPDLAIDVLLSRYGSIWAQAGLAPYAAQADVLATAADACAPCGPIGLTALNEPLAAPLARCAGEVAISPPDALAPAVRDCVDCSPEVACRRAFPSLIADLFALVRARLPVQIEVGVNLRGLGLLAELPAAVFSFTSDWIHQDTAWSQSALEQMAAVAGRLAGNTPVNATTGQRAPSATAHQALVLQLAALGAQPIRLAHWPPNSITVLDAIAATERTLAAVWPDFPARLQARLDTDHDRVWAAAYGDDLLVVINRTARTQSVRVDAGPLAARLPGAIEPILGQATVFWEAEVGLLRVGLPPHAAIMARVR